MHDLFRHPGHTLLLWAGSPAALAEATSLAAALDEHLPTGLVRCCLLVPAGLDVDHLSGGVYCDSEGLVAKAYGFGDPQESAGVASYLIRPDLYVGHRSSAVTVEQLLGHPASTYDASALGLVAAAAVA